MKSLIYKKVIRLLMDVTEWLGEKNKKVYYVECTKKVDEYYAKCKPAEDAFDRKVRGLIGKKITNVGGGPSEGGGVTITIVDEDDKEWRLWTDTHGPYCAGPFE